MQKKHTLLLSNASRVWEQKSILSCVSRSSWPLRNRRFHHTGHAHGILSSLLNYLCLQLVYWLRILSIFLFAYSLPGLLFWQCNKLGVPPLLNMNDYIWFESVSTEYNVFLRFKILHHVEVSKPVYLWNPIHRPSYFCFPFCWSTYKICQLSIEFCLDKTRKKTLNNLKLTFFLSSWSLCHL